MMITKRQIDYIDVLANDIGLDTRIKKMIFISDLLGYQVKFLDELAMIEGSKVIDELKGIKEAQRDRESDKSHIDWND